MTRALAAAVALVTGVAVPAAAQPAWEAGVAHEVRAFDAAAGSWDAWHETRAWVERRLRSGALRAEVRRADRFGAVDVGGAADAWLGLGSRAYAQFRVDLAPDAEALAEYGLRAEAYATLVPGWEASAGWGRRGYRDEAVDEPTASIAEYLGRWYLRQRVSAVYGGGEDGGLAVELIGRRTLAGPRDLVEAGVAFGPEPSVAGRGPVVETADRRAAWVRFEAFPWSRLGFALRGEAADFDPPLPDRRVLSAAVRTRW